MDQSPLGLLAQLEAARNNLTRSEARVADYVLNAPQSVLELSIEALSKAAGVSEPTVARFCKSVGFSGWKEFKIQVARSLGGGMPLVHQDVRADDPVGVAADDGRQPRPTRLPKSPGTGWPADGFPRRREDFPGTSGAARD